MAESLNLVLFVASFDSSSINFDDESKEATNENLRLNAMSPDQPEGQ